MKKLVLLVIWCACSRNPTEAEALDAFAARSADITRFEKQIVASYSSGQIVSEPKACKERQSGLADASSRACIRAYEEDIARVVTVNAALEAELVKLARETGANGFRARWFPEGTKIERVGDTERMGPSIGGIRWGYTGGGASGVVAPRDGVTATGGYQVGWGRYDDDERGFTARRAVPFDAGEILFEVSFPITRSE